MEEPRITEDVNLDNLNSLVEKLKDFSTVLHKYHNPTVKDAAGKWVIPEVVDTYVYCPFVFIKEAGKESFTMVHIDAVNKELKEDLARPFNK